MLDACEKREVQQNLVSPTMIGVDWQRLFIRLKRPKYTSEFRQCSVYYWVHRYLNHHRVADLYDASRTGRPRRAAQITKACILRELARDPLRLGYNTTIWTVPLLATHLSRRYDAQITPRTLRRRMKEVGLRWKRPRYVYVAKDPHRAQKKGRSSDV